MNEETLIFKAYSRGLLRQLEQLKKEVNDNNLQEAQNLIDELIADTQNNIDCQQSKIA